MANQILPDALQRAGLQWVGFEFERQQVAEQTNLRRFLRHFGADPVTLCSIFNDLEQNEKKTIDPQRYWFKSHAREANMAAMFKYDEKTVRKVIWEYAEKIRSLKAQKIMMEETLNDDVIFVMTVDGVHFRTRECRIDPNKNWYSHKFNGPGLSYELGIAIRKNQLCWINGPFQASFHDSKIFATNDGDVDDPVTKFRCGDGLKTQIPEGKRLI